MDRARWRATGNYRVHPRLQVGLEWNIAVNEVGPLATLFVLEETHTRPALFLGTSSDRIGSPEGTQSYYATIAKHIPKTRLAPYASVNYSEWDEQINFPFGANLTLTEGVSLMPMYDGERSHLLLTYARETAAISLIAVWYEQIGIAISGGF